MLSEYLFLLMSETKNVFPSFLTEKNVSKKTIAFKLNGCSLSMGYGRLSQVWVPSFGMDILIIDCLVVVDDNGLDSIQLHTLGYHLQRVSLVI